MKMNKVPLVSINRAGICRKCGCWPVFGWSLPTVEGTSLLLEGPTEFSPCNVEVLITLVNNAATRGDLFLRNCHFYGRLEFFFTVLLAFPPAIGCIQPIDLDSFATGLTSSQLGIGRAAGARKARVFRRTKPHLRARLDNMR